MSRRDFLARVSRACAGAAVTAALGTEPADAASPHAWRIHDPDQDAATRTLVDEVLGANVQAIQAGLLDPVVGWTVDPATLSSPEAVQKALRESGRRAVVEFPHSERSPLVRARSEGRVARLDVLLKLNLCGHDANIDMDYKNVHPAFVEGLVEGLQELGVSPERIRLADGARYAQANVMVGVLDAGGYLDLLARKGLSFLDLNAYEKVLSPASVRLLQAAGLPAERYQTSLDWVRMQPSSRLAAALPRGWGYPSLGAAGGCPLLPKEYVRHLNEGLVIDVPKFKVHRLAIVSGAIKNLMGVVGFRFPDTVAPHMEKAWIHDRFRFGKDGRLFVQVLEETAARLADVYLAACPHLSIFDGVLTAAGDGLSTVMPVSAPLVLASENAILADVAQADAAGFLGNPAMQRLLGLSMPPVPLAAMRRYHPGLAWKSVEKILDGKPAPRIAVARSPYYCLLAFRSPASTPHAPDSTALGTPPASTSTARVDTRLLRTPFHRMVSARVKTAKAAVRSAPSDTAPILFWLQEGQGVFARGTDKIRCRWLADGLTCASPTTGETVPQRWVWLLVDVAGDGQRTGWVAGGCLQLKR